MYMILVNIKEKTHKTDLPVAVAAVYRDGVQPY